MTFRYYAAVRSARSPDGTPRPGLCRVLLTRPYRFSPCS